uniref:CEP76-C2 domain-containing protein n=1 Tax=Panagrellus redivivus TaxID=6233 RepID=A0A7E4ZT14_PANRE
MARDRLILFSNKYTTVYSRTGANVKTYTTKDFSGLELVARSIKGEVPRDRIAAVYLLHVHASYDEVTHAAKVLNATGFREFETINSTSFVLTQVLMSTPSVRFRLGQLYHVVVNLQNDIHYNVESYVLKKTDSGFDVIDFSEGQNADLKEQLKGLDTVIIAHTLFDDPDEKYKKLFPNKKRVYTNPNSCFGADYFWNKFDGGNLDKWLVSNTAGMRIILDSAGSHEEIDLESVKVPCKRVFERWFKETYFVGIGVAYEKQGTNCNFDKVELDWADHKVRFTVYVGEDMLPVVSHEIITTKRKKPELSFLDLHLDDRPIAVYTSCIFNPPCFRAFYKDSQVQIDATDAETTKQLAVDLTVQLPVDKIKIIVDAYLTYTTLETRLERLEALKVKDSADKKAKPVKLYPISWLCLSLARVFKINNLDVPIGQCFACWDFLHCYILVRQSDGFHVIDWTEADVDVLDTYSVQTVVITRTLTRTEAMITAAIEALHPRTLLFYEFDDTFDDEFKDSIWNCNDNEHDGYFVHDFGNFSFNVNYGRTTKVFETGSVSLPHMFSVEIDVGSAPSLLVSYDLGGRFTKSKRPKTQVFYLQKYKTKHLVLSFEIKNAYDVELKLEESETPKKTNACSRLVVFEKVSNGFEKNVYLRHGDRPKATRFATLRSALQSLPHPELTAVVLDFNGLSIQERRSHFKLLRSYKFLLAKTVHDFSLTLDTNLYVNEPTVRNFSVGEQVFLFKTGVKAEKAKKSKKEPSFMTFVVKRSHTSFHLVKLGMFPISKLRSDFSSVRRGFVFGEGENRKQFKGLKVEFLTQPEADNKFLDGVVGSGLLLKQIAMYNFEAEWEGGSRVFETEYQVPPFLHTVALRVQQCDKITIKVNLRGTTKGEVLTELKFDRLTDGVVVFTISMDKFLLPSSKLVRTVETPTTIIEITTDNRTVIHSAAYKGRTEFPAYISFKDKIKIAVGDVALALLETQPFFIVYDVGKLLNINFDLMPANPEWKFTTFRSDDGELHIRIGSNTCPVYMLFAYVVKATFLAVKEEVFTEFKAIGVQLPEGCTLSEEWRQKLSETMRVQLVVFS